jgi:poly-gamma-glutamate synthesis protein (capsule biosynthesis protein)
VPPTASSSPPPPDSFTLVATGDVLIHQDLDLTAGAQRPDGSYDFSGVLAPVARLIGDADLAICHLETPVAPAGGPYRGYPSFAVQPEIVDALAGVGYDLCSTASNHSLDDGIDGLARTLDALDAAGIAHTGTYRTQADALEPTLVEVGGVTVGHVAGTFGLNGVSLPAGREWAVDIDAVPDVDGMLAAAARARAAGAEVVVASLHCCLEYDHDPTDAQVAAVRTLLASPDVDLVVGHHAHVVQPFEQIDGKWVAYGLGNFVAQMAREGDPYDEVAARFTFTRGPDGRFAVSKAEAVPLHLDVLDGRAQVVPADAEAFQRVAAALDRRGAVAAGLGIVHG